MPRPIILIFVECYLPGFKYGGPIVTISNMVERLSNMFDFWIITADRDFKDKKPYPNVNVNCWNKIGNAKVFYASPKNRSLMSFACLINKIPHDVLYLNSFFDPIFTAWPLLVRYFGLIPKLPTIIAPRGEFSKGALALKSWKKGIYITIVKALGLYRNLTWHASSVYEVNAIQKIMGSTAKSIVIAPVLPAISIAVTDGTLETIRTRDGALRMCFFSRISPKKNLDYALRVLVEVKVLIEFSIYGVMEDEPYWQHCQELIKRLPSHVVVRYHGIIDHTKVAETLAKYDLFFFPTRGENYGHVIFEALSSGLPVLISDQTPWRNLESLGVGWDLPLNDTEKFRAVIERQAKLNFNARTEQRRRIQQYAKLASADNKVLSDTIALFTNIISKEK